MAGVLQAVQRDDRRTTWHNVRIREMSCFISTIYVVQYYF